LLVVVLRLLLLVMEAPFLKAPFLLRVLLACAGGTTATFAGGVVMAPSLYVS
jgi:hypothetical protein